MGDQLLRLATGSHRAGSGKGCAMNVISWENGDTTITDLPACADEMLARVVQRVNDWYCTHRNGSDLLCPTCSIEVLALAHRTVGTFGGHGIERRRVWVRLACMAAREVVHLNTDQRVMAAILAAEAWADNPTANAAYAAYAAAYAAADAAAADAANAAAYAAADAAYAAAYPYAAAAYAAYAAYAAAYAADAAAYAMRLAHKLIDEFNRLTGHHEPTVDDARTQRAITQMCETR